MQTGSRVYLISHPRYYGTIVDINFVGELIVEWDDAPGIRDIVEPFDIEESEDPYYMAAWYKSVRDAKAKRMNEILGIK